MARPSKRRSPAPKGGKTGPLIFATSVAIAAAILFLWAVPRDAAASHHPTPHEHANSDKVVSAERFAADPRIAEIYTMAAAIPHLLDGLYCHCDCSKHAGHRSLLECFESDHGANCDVCLGEAALAYRLDRDGESLEDIRAAIDMVYGGGG